MGRLPDACAHPREAHDAERTCVLCSCTARAATDRLCSYTEFMNHEVLRERAEKEDAENRMKQLEDLVDVRSRPAACCWLAASLLTPASLPWIALAGPEEAAHGRARPSGESDVCAASADHSPLCLQTTLETELTKANSRVTQAEHDNDATADRNKHMQASPSLQSQLCLSFTMLLVCARAARA